MRDSERRSAITRLIAADNKKYSNLLTEQTSLRVRAAGLRAAGHYCQEVLDALSGNASFKYMQIIPEGEGISKESVTLDELIRRIREEERVMRGDKVIYPSRPLLTAMSVRALIGQQMRLRAHLNIEGSQNDESLAKFYAFNSTGLWVEYATLSIDRAEGTLMRGAREEALRTIADPTKASEIEIAYKSTRFQEYSDRLVRDKTGISTMEISTLYSMYKLFGPEAVAGSEKLESIALIYRILGELAAVQAYREIYRRTDFSSQS